MSLECLSNVNDSPGDQTNVTLTLSLSWERIDANVCWPLVAPAVTALCQSPGPDTDMTSEVTDMKTPKKKSGERQQRQGRFQKTVVV